MNLNLTTENAARQGRNQIVLVVVLVIENSKIEDEDEHEDEEEEIFAEMHDFVI